MLKIWELIDKDQKVIDHNKVALSPGLRAYPLSPFFP